MPTKPSVQIEEMACFIKLFFPDFSDSVEDDPSLFKKTIQISQSPEIEKNKHELNKTLSGRRLLDFLSHVNREFKEAEFKGIVYLSKSTPRSERVSSSGGSQTIVWLKETLRKIDSAINEIDILMKNKQGC